MLKVVGSEGAVGVLVGELAKQRGKALVRLFAAWLTKHFAEHVNDPRAFAVDDAFISRGRF